MDEIERSKGRERIGWIVWNKKWGWGEYRKRRDNLKTRKKNKKSNKLIVRRRDGRTFK